jgi:hypothetical protein
MKRDSIDNATPIRITVYCLLCLVAATALGARFLGMKELVNYARLIRPYWIIYNTLPSEVERSPRNGSADVETRERIIFSLGDSNTFFPEYEKCDLANLLQDAMRNTAGSPPIKVYKWHYSGANMFDYYCMFYEAMKHSPDVILVPVYWKAFHEEYVREHFHPEMSMFVPLRERFALTRDNPLDLRGISLVNHFQYKLSRFSIYPEGIRTWGRERMRALLNESIGIESATIQSPSIGAAFFRSDPFGGGPSFPMKITDSNLTLRSLSALARVASRREVKMLFYIWPLDHESFGGPGKTDRAAFRQSRRLVVEAARKENVRVVDLSYFLEHKYFVDVHGHCCKEGRERIAEALAPIVLEMSREDSGLHE